MEQIVADANSKLRDQATVLRQSQWLAEGKPIPDKMKRLLRNSFTILESAEAQNLELKANLAKLLEEIHQLKADPSAAFLALLKKTQPNSNRPKYIRQMLGRRSKKL